jgi:hypothetical protein
MQKADYLLRLMKQRTDALVASDEKLQQFLMWVSEISASSIYPYKPAAIRAFEFDIARIFNRAFSLSCFQDIYFLLAVSLGLKLAPNLIEVIQYFQNQLLDIESNEERFEKWWQANNEVVIKKLKSTFTNPEHLVCHWQFNEQQQKLLLQYYDANKLLVDCLNSCSNVTPEVRSHIEETLLLPIALIEKTCSCQDK